jgi:hypothetical protein
VEHHSDGSHTVHHVHEQHGFQGPAVREGDVKGAAGDHDGMLDHVMDHTSAPNEGEDQDEEGQPYKGEEALEEMVHPGIHAKIEQIKKGK